MRPNKHFFIVLLAVTFILSIIPSCKKENQTEYQNFVSKEFILNYKIDYIKNLLDAGSGTYPELNDFNALSTHPVNIYKVVYKTEIAGKEINASGLLCVPADGGEYPVLCFQNGTNTNNAYSPTEYVLNPVYQFVEIIASMGFVVIIPDYPGFGESSDIPHPYLVKEPTVKSILDMLNAVHEMDREEIPGLTVGQNLFLMGYSQGGWATLSLHKAIEKDNPGSFQLKGSVCGAGPYDLTRLFKGMILRSTYPSPVYIGYIINSYSVYNQFSNPVSDILKEPFASRLKILFNGTLGSDQINNQLTTSIPNLFTTSFLSGFETDIKYSSVRTSLEENSISPWNTLIPLFFIHGGSDMTVDPATTEALFSGMITAGTSPQICRKEILPGLDHDNAVVPAMVKGLLFIRNLQ